MLGSPFSARRFFRDPRSFVERFGNGRALLHLRAGPQRLALVREPEEIWRVLVTDGAAFAAGKWKRRARRFVGPTLNTLHGDEHANRRRVLRPALARARVEAHGPAMAEDAQRAAQALRAGERIRLREVLDPLSLTMAARVLVSADLGGTAFTLADDLGRIMSALPRAVPPYAVTRHGRALARTGEAAGSLLRERRQSGEPGDDLVGALVADGLPDETARGEVIAFFLAAVDEPPSALEAAWYLLSRHPEADARLHEELDSVLGDRPASLDDRPALVYLDAVLRETMRLFPPARHIDRCPLHDVRIGGEQVRAGANVVISPLVTHGELSLHDRASEFDPERWLGSGRTSRKGTYFPFGPACTRASESRWRAP